MEGLDGGIFDVDWGVKIRLADFKMQDVSPLGFQSLRTRQYFEGGFRPQPVHPLGIGHHADYLLTGLHVS